MALPSSGKITLSQIQAEFGGPSVKRLKAYYRDAGFTTANNTRVPASGKIKFSDFYDAAIYQSGSVEFLTAGTYSVTIPPGVTSITINMTGAGGGSSAGDSIPNRGLPGHRVTTTIRVTPGETLTISIGGGGIGGNWQSAGQPGVGMFSGGQGGYGASSGNGGGGGAASVILRGSDILVVAAGGGGAGGAGRNTAASAASGAAAPTPTGGKGNNGNGDSGGGGGGGGGYPFGGVGGIGGSGDSGGQQGSTGQSFSIDPMTTTSAANGGTVSGVTPNPGGNGSCTISW